MRSKLTKSNSDLEVLPPDPPFWTKTSWLQLGYGVWVNMTVMGIGLAFGFPAVTIPQLRNESSGVKMTLSDEAWIASVLTLSSPIGSLICGLLMDRYGRSLVLVLCEIPMCFGWLYTGFSKTTKDIIIGRLIAGVGLGMAITAPRAYITEITLPNMRGVIGALPNLFISLGLTIQAGLGSFLNWTILCYICACYSILMMGINIFLPDTPYFLLMKPTTPTASTFKVNLRRFRSSRFNVDAELEALYDFRNENNIRSLSLKDQIKALFKPSSCKPYGIVTVYACFTQLAGVNVVIMWAVEMLETANTSVNGHLGNFILAFTRIIFGLLTSVLLFRVGRRVMAMVSAIGVGVVSISLCIFLHVSKEKSVIPLFIFMAYIAFASLGYYTLPFLMMFELLPLQIRGLLSGICISQMNLLMFAMNNCYPYIRLNLGLPNTMAMFGIMSLLGALILYFILPETKGLTLQEIEEFFNSRRPTLISQRQVMSDQLHNQSRMTLGVSKSNLNLKKGLEKRWKSRESVAKTNDTNVKDLEEVKMKLKDLKEKHYEENFLNDKHSENKEKQIKENEDLINSKQGTKDEEQNLERKEKGLTDKDNVEKDLKDEKDSIGEKSSKTEEKDLVTVEKELKAEKDSIEGKSSKTEEKDLVTVKTDLKDEKDSIGATNSKIEEKVLTGKESDDTDEKRDLKDVETVSKEEMLKGEEKNAIYKEKGPKDKKEEMENDSKDEKLIDSKDETDSKYSKDSKKSHKEGAIIFKNIDDSV